MERNYDKYRSWIEVDFNAINHNINELMTLLENRDQFMAVVKADAYGHGAVDLCHMMSEQGIKSYAVATLAEAIELRENHIMGDILILGYTDPRQSHLLNQYHLIQTIVDFDYAMEFNAQEISVDVHIAIDTGMHRLGISSVDEIKKIFSFPYLHIKGIFSHLCVCDSDKKDDIQFTYQQIKLFEDIIHILKQENYDVGKVHLQSSYGLLNYSNLNYDYVRIGISLFGVYSSLHDKRNDKIQLKPALSLKSQIIHINEVEKEETIGYGRTYTTIQKTKIAVIPIGYADGVPRSLSNKGQVIVKGQRVPIVGRICMDQMMIDVTGVQDVSLHDVVTIVGEDDQEKISIEELADLTDTITNELLSRLGYRLPRIYKGGENIEETLSTNIY